MTKEPVKQSREQERLRGGLVDAALIAAVAALVVSLTIALITVSIGIARAGALTSLSGGDRGIASRAAPGDGSGRSQLRRAAYP